MSLRQSIVAALAAVALAIPPAFAADPPFSDAPVNVSARGKDLPSFVTDFFAAAGIRATVDASVKGRINGQFSGVPAAVWSRVARAFNLIAYYDGSVVTVYAASQVQTRTVSVSSGRASDMVAAAARAGLIDSTNKVQATGSDSVLATGVPRFLDQAQQIASGMPIRRNDTPGTAEIAPANTARRVYRDQVEPYELRVFYLRYSRADDTTLNAGGREILVAGVGSTLSKIMGDGSPVAGSVGTTYGNRTLRQSQPRLLGKGLDSVPPDQSQATPYDSDYLGLPSGGDTARAVPASASGYLQSGPRIAIDPSLNAVIVRDRPENMPAYEGLVRALDIRPQLVELEATIIDINIDKLRDIGINWRVNSQGFNALFGGDIVRRTGNPVTDTTNTGAPNEGLSLGAIIGAHQEFIGRIQALETKGAARIVSRPQLLTLSNVEAVFDRTRTFYVRVAGDRQVDLFNVTAGTVLRVNPHILFDNGVARIRMVVGVEDGSVTSDRVDRIPVIERASVNTQAMINEGEGLLLGGMTVNADYDSESKIPLLGDIPVVGELFKSRHKQKQRIERLFLITPRIVSLDAATAPGVGAAAPMPGSLSTSPSGNPLPGTVTPATLPRPSGKSSGAKR
jgi:type III secretion protein C